MRNIKTTKLFLLVSKQQRATKSVSRLILSSENLNELFDRLQFILLEKSDGNDRKDLILKFLRFLKNYSIKNALP